MKRKDFCFQQTWFDSVPLKIDVNHLHIKGTINIDLKIDPKIDTSGTPHVTVAILVELFSKEMVVGSSSSFQIILDYSQLDYSQQYCNILFF